MVLHNDRWHKKAARNYRRKHGIPNPNKKKDESDSSSDENENFETNSISEVSDNEEEHSGDETLKAKIQSDTKNVEEAGSGTLFEHVDLKLKEAGIDVSQFSGKRNKKKLGNNDWRYHDEDDLEALLARDPSLRYDPEFQEKLQRKQEEEVFEAEQLRLAREVTKKKFEAEKKRQQEEEEEEEREDDSDDYDYDRYDHTKAFTLEELEDDSDDDVTNFEGVLDTKKKNAYYGKKSHIKKLTSEEMIKFREIQRNIDQANFESSVARRIGGKNVSGLSSNLRSLKLDSDKPTKTKTLVLGDDGKAKMVISNRNGDGLLKNLSQNKTAYGDVKKSNGVFESQGVEDVDDFLSSLDNRSKEPEHEDEDEVSNDSDSDSDDDFDFKQRLAQKNKSVGGKSLPKELDFLNL